MIGLREFNLDQFEEDYTQLLDKALESGLRTFVTEIPFTVHEKHNRAIASANRIIRKLTLDKGIYYHHCPMEYCWVNIPWMEFTEYSNTLLPDSKFQHLAISKFPT